MKRDTLARIEKLEKRLEELANEARPEVIVFKWLDGTEFKLEVKK